jgi:cytochrome c551/c552
MPAGVTIKALTTTLLPSVEKSGESRKTIAMVGSVVSAIAFNFTSKADAKGKLNVEIAMGTMSMMKQVVNETGAYVLQARATKRL